MFIIVGARNRESLFSIGHDFAVLNLGGDGLPKQPIFTGAVIPLALGAIAVASVRDTALARTLVALAWTVAAGAAAFLQPAARSTHLMTGGIASGATLLFALEDRAVESCVALSVHAAALSLLLRRARTRLLGVPIATRGASVITTNGCTIPGPASCTSGDAFIVANPRLR